MGRRRWLLVAVALVAVVVLARPVWLGVLGQGDRERVEKAYDLTSGPVALDEGGSLCVRARVTGTAVATRAPSTWVPGRTTWSSVSLVDTRTRVDVRECESLDLFRADSITVRDLLVVDGRRSGELESTASGGTAEAEQRSGETRFDDGVTFAGDDLLLRPVVGVDVATSGASSSVVVRPGTVTLTAG